MLWGAEKFHFLIPFFPSLHRAKLEIEEKKRQAEIEAERKRIEEEKAKQKQLLKQFSEKKEKKAASRWRKGKRWHKQRERLLRASWQYILPLNDWILGSAPF